VCVYKLNQNKLTNYSVLCWQWFILKIFKYQEVNTDSLNIFNSPDNEISIYIMDKDSRFIDQSDWPIVYVRAINKVLIGNGYCNRSTLLSRSDASSTPGHFQYLFIFSRSNKIYLHSSFIHCVSPVCAGLHRRYNRNQLLMTKT